MSTTEELKKKLPQLYSELKNPEEFKKMYKFVFDFARDKSFKNLNIEVAIDLWDLLLSTKCNFLSVWTEFLKNEKKDQLVIPKDTWNMLLELIVQTDGNFSSFQDDGTWPPMIDQFTEYYNKKRGGK